MRQLRDEVAYIGMYMKKFTFNEANEIMKNGFLNTDTPYEEINSAEKSFGIKRYSDCLCNRCGRKDVCYIGSEETHNWVDETIHNAIMECNYFMKLSKE